MSENVEGVEVTWDNNLIWIKFVDLFGDGEAYGFTPEEMTVVRDTITEALHRQGLR